MSARRQADTADKLELDPERASVRQLPSSGASPHAYGGDPAALVASGLLEPNQLEEARRLQDRTRRPFAHVLLDLGFVTEQQLPEVHAALTGLPLVTLHECPLDAAASALIPESMARRHAVVPIGFEGDKLVVAVADPQNVILVDDIRMTARREVTLVIAAREDIDDVLNRAYSVDHIAVPAEEADTGLDDAATLEMLADQAPVVRLINQLIGEAVQQRASDVHLEPEERYVRVRYRIDGVMHETARIPKAFQAGLISRVKVMAEANIAERRLPQDARVTRTIAGRQVDLRVATLPASWGEDVTLRILDRSASLLNLEDLGYAEDILTQYYAAIRRTNGLILVTGPTGSGKSTTLYGTLNRLNDDAKKIITVEDPIEYTLPGLRQVQVHPQIGLSFARALRSILRCDPDIVMVGEIRDAETASMAINAAMTGHLVLATLHTNDAPSAATRLVDMGVEPFLVASALTCVVAQRLARRLCPRCVTHKPVGDAGLESSRWLWGDTPPPTVPQATGCGYCSRSGYRGRVAVAELMTCTDDVSKLIAERSSTQDITIAAASHGMRPLLEDGLDKVRNGVTTVEELLRVVS